MTHPHTLIRPGRKELEALQRLVKTSIRPDPSFRASDIARELGVSYQAVTPRLWQLAHENLVYPLNDGWGLWRWCLTGDGWPDD